MEQFSEYEIELVSDRSNMRKVCTEICFYKSFIVINLLSC